MNSCLETARNKMQSNALLHRLSIGLSLALFLQCIALFYETTLGGSPIGTFFFMEIGLPEHIAYGIDRYSAMSFVSLSILMIYFVLLGKENDDTKVRVPALLIAFGFLFLASVTFYNGGSFGARFSLLSYFARIFLPVAVLGLAMKKEATLGYLRIAIAITFATHGIEALLLHPQFIDYLIVGFERLLRIQLSEANAGYLLRFIGAGDILAGFLILSKRWKKVALWMTFWGFATAMIRLLYYGGSQWHHFAIRSSHFSIPLAIYLFETYKKNDE